jgi:hypothetical protein
VTSVSGTQHVAECFQLLETLANESESDYCYIVNCSNYERRLDFKGLPGAILWVCKRPPLKSLRAAPGLAKLSNSLHVYGFFDVSDLV